MNPLVEEYFKRDLTEAEEQQLAEGLSASPEDAQRLAEGLADLYQKSGLPEPVWPGRTSPPFGNSIGWIKPLIPAALILALLGFSAYKWLTHSPAPAAEPLTAPPASGSENIPVRKVHALAKSVQKIKKDAPALDQPLSASSLELPALQTAPAAPGRLYEQLSVVVEPVSPGLITVRVLDGGGHELKMLYAGIIPAGRRTFTWDGQTLQGKVAPAGTYFIEVKSGEKVMRKEVKIGGN